MSKKSDFIGVDLFAGAGGMTAGAKMAGVDVQFAVENDKYSAETYSFNNKKVQVHKEDIRELDSVPQLDRKGKQLVVFGGPPCQGFSTSNSKTRNKNNPNNWLYKEFFRVIKLFRPLPEWIVFENVKGFSTTESGSFVTKVINELEKLEYAVSYSILNASDYGIPQKRNRFFIVASKKGVEFDFTSLKKSKDIITVKDAFDDLPYLKMGNTKSVMGYRKDPTSEYAEKMRGKLKESENHLVTQNTEQVLKRYKHVPPGGNWQNIPKYLMKSYADSSRCHSGIYRRLDGKEPSVVIGNFRKNMLIHPRQDRGLSIREAARLQSFPDKYVFKGSINSQQQQVGNAVPPYLAKKIFQLFI